MSRDLAVSRGVPAEAPTPRPRRDEALGRLLGCPALLGELALRLLMHWDMNNWINLRHLTFGFVCFASVGPAGGCTNAGSDEDTDGTGAETGGSSTEDAPTTGSSEAGSGTGEGSTEGSDTTSALDSSSSSSSDTDDSGAPTIVEVDCRYEISPDLAVGVDYLCGDLMVPERRADPDSPEISVHFVRFFGPPEGTNATIYLDGGPGSAGQEFAGLPGVAIKTFAADGDFVVIAQRGTALSEPALMCEDTGGGPLANAEACREGHTADGVQLGSFTTPENADDVEDLRIGLDYTQWNLLGISYGTRLALEIMRRHPDSVRGAMIDGVVPADVNWDMRSDISFWQATQGIAAACAADTTCAETFGAYDQALLDMIDALNETPLEVGGPGAMVQLDGDTVAGVIFQLTYVTGFYPALPLMVTSFRDGNVEAISILLEAFLGGSGGDSIARAMHWSVKCSDLQNPELGPGIDIALMEASVPEPLATRAQNEYQVTLDLCADWPKPEPDPGLTMPVSSGIPTLVSSGAFDPVTPPGFAEHAAETLSASVEVVFANSGHGALTESECSQGIALSFLADPEAALTDLDTSCADEIGIGFVTTQEEFLGGLTPERQHAIATQIRRVP